MHPKIYLFLSYSSVGLHSFYVVTSTYETGSGDNSRFQIDVLDKRFSNIPKITKGVLILITDSDFHR